MSISNTGKVQGQKATPLLPSKFGRYTSPHVYEYTFIIKLLLQFHFLDLLVPHWWDVALSSSIDSEPDSKMGTFVLQALLVDEIRERAKAFEPKSFNDNFNWPFIFRSALKATISFLFSPVNPAAHSHLMSLSYMCDVPPEHSGLMFQIFFSLHPNLLLHPPTLCQFAWQPFTRPAAAALSFLHVEF